MWMIETVPPDAPCGDAHLLPVGDLISHEISDECVCGPAVEGMKRPSGSIGWVYTHRALDGRR